MIRTILFSVAILVSTCAMTGQASAFHGHQHHGYCGGPVYSVPVQSHYRGPGDSSYYRSPRISVGYGGYGGYGNRGYDGFGHPTYGYPGYRSGISIGFGSGGFGRGFGYGGF